MFLCDCVCCVEEKLIPIESMMEKYDFTELQYNTLKNAGITDLHIEYINIHEELKGLELYSYLLKVREKYIHKKIIPKKKTIPYYFGQTKN